MKKNIVIIALLAAAVAVVVGIRNRETAESGCGTCASGTCALPTSAGLPDPEAAQASTVAHKPLPKLLDLGADTCVPCKMMAPILVEMKETFAGQLEVEFIDVWKNEAAGEQYGIRMIPTQIFFDADGSELFRHEGFYARDDILARWEALGFAFTGAPLHSEQITSNAESE